MQHTNRVPVDSFELQTMRNAVEATLRLENQRKASKNLLYIVEILMKPSYPQTESGYTQRILAQTKTLLS